MIDIIDGVSIGAPISKSFDNWFGAIEKKRVGKLHEINCNCYSRGTGCVEILSPN